LRYFERHKKWLGPQQQRSITIRSDVIFSALPSEPRGQQPAQEPGRNSGINK
jgi:hypothetical protein